MAWKPLSKTHSILLRYMKFRCPKDVSVYILLCCVVLWCVGWFERANVAVCSIDHRLACVVMKNMMKWQQIRYAKQKALRRNKSKNTWWRLTTFLWILWFVHFFVCKYGNCRRTKIKFQNKVYLTTCFFFCLDEKHWQRMIFDDKKKFMQNESNRFFVLLLLWPNFFFLSV